MSNSNLLPGAENFLQYLQDTLVGRITFKDGEYDRINPANDGKTRTKISYNGIQIGVHTMGGDISDLPEVEQRYKGRIPGYKNKLIKRDRLEDIPEFRTTYDGMEVSITNPTAFKNQGKPIEGIYCWDNERGFFRFLIPIEDLPIKPLFYNIVNGFSGQSVVSNKKYLALDLYLEDCPGCIAKAPLGTKKYFEFPGWELYDSSGRRLTATRLTQMAHQKKKEFHGTAVSTMRFTPLEKEGKPMMMRIDMPRRKLAEIVSLHWQKVDGIWQRSDYHPIPFP